MNNIRYTDYTVLDADTERNPETHRLGSKRKRGKSIVRRENVWSSVNE